jgi:uncharacterized protein with FMN-binding domain
MVTPMKRIVIWLASTVTIVVLLFGYHTSTDKTAAAGAPAPAPAASSSGTGTNSSSSGSSGSGSASSGSSGSGSSGSGSSGSGSTGSSSGSTSTKSYTGSVAETRWGPVEVKITVTGKKITAVDVLQYPDGNQRDAEINSYALPTLVQETIAAQGAQIDMVSGATVTSDGYLQSLQSALDEAGI